MEKRAKKTKEEALSYLLEDLVRIPGTKISFGLDALVGFFLPGWGDTLTAVASLWIIVRAYKNGAPKSVVWQMIWNVVLDLLLGLIPILGDASDLLFKSNTRNLALLREHQGRSTSKAKPRSFLATLSLALAGLMCILIFGLLSAALGVWFLLRVVGEGCSPS